MFIFHIYSSFETEGHCRDQGDFLSTENIKFHLTVVK